MKKIQNWDEVKEAGTFTPLPVGPQICKIIAVIDDTNKEYLKIEFDIADGEFKGTFAESEKQFGEWPIQGTTWRSYKPTAYSFFKNFITAIEKSNPGYNWNWDEQTLVKKFFVANFGEEEYEDGGAVKVSIKCREFRSLQSFREGKIKPLEIKKLKNAPVSRPAYATLEANDALDEELPF